MGIPKSLDYKDFMNKSTSANPTTWDDMYRFFGNQGEITAALVKSLLYQPSTAYSIGAIVYSPNLPAGTIAKCTVAGTTGSTEPVWPAVGFAVNDGTVRWLVENMKVTAAITVDTELSGTSNNAISNKAVYEALSGKLDKTGTATAAIKATQDGEGNVIATTYIKTINNLKPDDSGNINISTGGGSGSGVSTSTQNTWTAKQNFQYLKFNFESFATSRISGTYDSPSKSVAAYNVTGALTLDMSTLAGMIGNGDTSIFIAYIASNGSYALSITNAGTLKYAGSAADLAITASGLLLNIFLTKNTSGVVTSIAQATKLS